MLLPESFLKLVWQKGLFSSAHLTTTDGRPVSILSPGIPNTDGGPDFSDARIRIGTITFQGDVELHRTAKDWHLHGHQRDPHYNRVILHVVLTADDVHPPAVTAAHRTLPLLVLHPFLDPATRPAVMASLNDESSGELPSLPCRRSPANLPAASRRKWLEHLAEARMEMKLHRFEVRLRELIDEKRRRIAEPYPRYYGNPDDIPRSEPRYTARDAAASLLWETLLYEGFMEGLGYAKNENAFAGLARSVPPALLRRVGPNNTADAMALLFGTAGLLPSTRTVDDRDARRYLRPLRRRWRELRPLVSGPLLHEGDWKFFRLRPTNFPTVRLAAFVHLLPRLLHDEAFHELVTLFKTGAHLPSARYRILVDRFRDVPNDFWRNHYRFGPSARVPVHGLGPARIGDLVVNVVLPVMLLYARVFRDAEVRNSVRSLLLWMPAAQQNSITRLLMEQLPGERMPLRSVYLQQGAIHLYKMYCTAGRCKECDIGRAVG